MSDVNININANSASILWLVLFSLVFVFKFAPNIKIFILFQWPIIQKLESKSEPKKACDDRTFNGEKSDWLSLSVDKQLDRILTSMEKKRIQREYGDDYEEYDENDALEIRDAKMLRNVSRKLRQRRQRRNNNRFWSYQNRTLAK